MSEHKNNGREHEDHEHRERVKPSRSIDWEEVEKPHRSHNICWGVAAVMLVCIGFMLGMMVRPGRAPDAANPDLLPAAALSTMTSNLRAELPAVPTVHPESRVPTATMQTTEPAGATLDEGETGEAVALPRDPAAIPDAAAAQTIEPPEDTVGAESTGFRGPVGAAGWAIHLFSFPERRIAVAEVEKLARRGYDAEYRATDLGKKGVWFRVYVGSFASKAAAYTARDALMADLRLDWALPVRY